MNNNVLPQQDAEMEMAVLAVLLQDSKATAEVRTILRVSDFNQPRNQDIYAAIVSVYDYDPQAPVDAASVRSVLRSAGKLELCDHDGYIDRLRAIEVEPARVCFYAQRVKREALLRRQEQAVAQFHQMIKSPDADPTDIAVWMREQMDEVSQRQQGGLLFVHDMLSKHLEILRERQDSESRNLYTSGFPSIDRFFGRWGEPRLIVLKARRGTGKTHFLVETSMRCVKSGRVAAVFSMEMNRHQFIDRCIAHEGGIDSLKLNGKMSQEQLDKALVGINRLDLLPLAISDKCGLTASDIHAECRALVVKGHNIGYVGIDYAELLGFPPRAQSGEEALRRNAEGLRNIANDLNCTVVLLSQMNKDGGERGCEGIGNAADLLLAMADVEGQMMITTEKNRFGPGFSFPVTIDKTTSRMGELEDERPEPKDQYWTK